jgi:hypothetical protein
MNYNLKYLKYKNKYINLKNMIGNGDKPKTQQEIKKNKLMRSLTGIKNETDRSNLIDRLLKNDLTDEQINILNNNLFINNYYININKKESFYILLNFTPIKFDLLKKIIDSKTDKKYYLYSFDRIIEIINDKIILANLNQTELVTLITDIDTILKEEKEHSNREGEAYNKRANAIQIAIHKAGEESTKELDKCSSRCGFKFKQELPAKEKAAAIEASNKFATDFPGENQLVYKYEQKMAAQRK